MTGKLKNGMITYFRTEAGMCKEQKSKLESEELQPASKSSKTSTNGTYIMDGRVIHDLVYRGEAEVTDTDLISRQAAIEAIEKYDFSFPEYMERFVTELRDAMKKDLLDEVKLLPPVEPKAVCEDAISRADAIKTFIKWCKKEFGYFDINREERFIDAINSLPSVEPERPRGEWIPISDRFPYAKYGEGDLVLCCTETGLMHILYWNGGNWCVPTGEPHEWVNHKTGWHDRIIAWIPLPEPYREESEVE